MNSIIPCAKCKSSVGNHFKWAYFDKQGKLVRGECVHGVRLDPDVRRELEEDIVDGFKFFIEAECTV